MKDNYCTQSVLGKLSVDFRRFDERMNRLADNIRKANEEAGQVKISSRKISDHFARIEAVEMKDDLIPDSPPDKLK